MIPPLPIVNLAARHWKLIVAIALFVFGVLAGRVWFPRIQILQVDREVLKIVEEFLPGETRTMPL